MNFDQLEYRVVNNPLPQIVEQLKKTVYGSKGLKYSHNDVEIRVGSLVNPDFHTLWKGSELLALAAYCNREVFVGEGKMNAYYIRYFSVKKELQGKGLGKLLTNNIQSYYEAKLNVPTLFYAYIESENTRSLAVSESFKQIDLGRFKTTLFSRFNPTMSCELTTLEKKDLLPLLMKRSLFHTNKIGEVGSLVGSLKNGQVVCGAQISVVEWDVVSMPGLTGWLSRNVFHYLPYLGRLSPRNKFRFLVFEGLVSNGSAKELEAFIESCLSKSKCNVAMFYDDEINPMHEQYKKLKLGLMAKIQTPPKAKFLASFINVPEEQISGLKNEVKYISPFDLT